LLSKARISADGYNLVQQGDVTRIVQMGGIERRRVLDSISGIASYDADISRAQAERAVATENLDRISFILDELTRQIDALKKDMEAATKYLTIQDRLKMSKAQMVFRNLEDRRNELAGSERNRVEAMQALDAIKQDLIAKAQTIDNLTNEINEVEADIIERAGSEYKKISDDILQLSVDIANLSDRIERMEAENEEHASSIKQNEEDTIETNKVIASLTAEIDNNSIIISEKSSERDAEAEKVARIQEELSAKGGALKGLQERLAALEPRIDRAEEKEADLRSAATSFATRKEEISRSLAASEEAVKDTQFNIKDAEFSLAEIRKELKDNGADAIRERITAEKTKERELETKESELVAAASRINQEYLHLKAEKKVTDAIRGSAAVTRILELRDTGALKGIHGTVMELASVDKEYETALSIAAGNKMQAIIVDDDQVAADAMAVIKRENLGRATFLPLNKMMDGKPRAKAIMVAKDTEGYAIDLLDFDEMYRSAFWYVFADTLVCRTLTDARRIMGGVRLVTMDGELLEASGAMVGGSVAKNALKFGATSQGKLDEVAAEYRAVSASLESLRAQIRDVRSGLRTLEDQLMDANKGNADVQGKIGRLESQIKVLLEEKGRQEEAQRNNRSVLSQIESMEMENANELSACVAELESMRSERAQIREKITEIAPAELSEALDQARTNVYNLNMEVNNLVAKNAELASDRSSHENAKAMMAKATVTYVERIE
ncbi:MAG: hypothetical protein IKA33_00615, partial [Candidatus Methanomethylophilaceae archaeon]|nr:hypothetical protein [Candidatus Methanomethylophilaceae archaeon]